MIIDIARMNHQLKIVLAQALINFHHWKFNQSIHNLFLLMLEDAIFRGKNICINEYVCTYVK